MEITEVRIKLMDEPNDRLQAFCSITFDNCFVVRDLKIIQGTRGPFVAMPSRKLNDRCGKCGYKNELRSAYCSGCGIQLNQDRAGRDTSGRAKLYADIAHPINTECREMIQARVLKAFEAEMVRAGQPNYSCRYDDYGESEYTLPFESPKPATPDPTPKETPAEPIHYVDRAQQPRRIDAAENTVPSPVPAEKSRQRETTLSAYEEPEDDGFGIGIE